MADITITKGLIGNEDIAQHDLSAGTPDTVQTYSRTRASDTGTVTRTRQNATHIGLLDPEPVLFTREGVKGYSAVADASKTVEACLLSVRQNTPQFINFEARGGINSLTTADAKAFNTDLLAALVAELIAAGRGGGIFFPGGSWNFSTPNGYISGPIIDVSGSGADNIVLTGVGAGSQLIHDNAQTVDFIRFEDCSGIIVSELQVDKGGGAASCIKFESTTASENYNKIMSCQISNGVQGIQFLGASGSTNRQQNFVVYDTTFLSQTGRAVLMDNAADGKVLENRIDSPGAAGGIGGQAGGANESMSGHEIKGNVNIGSGEMQISIIVTAAFVGSDHFGHKIVDNKCSDIVVTRTTQLTCNENELSGGGIAVSLDQGTTASALTFLNNVVDNAGTGTSGINITGNSNVNGITIAHGSIFNPGLHGININMSGATTAKWINIGGVRILDANDDGAALTNGVTLHRQDGTTDSCHCRNSH
jgi:hypothetical protein